MSQGYDPFINSPTARRISLPPSAGQMTPPSFVDSLMELEIGDERTLMDQIDQLRACGIDKYVHLPQIVVVGDQSAGKSSVLGDLTGVQFPKSESRCTRFATEIRLRRSNVEKKDIRIIPDGSRSEADRRRLAGFSESVRHEEDFTIIMAQAIDAIYANRPTGQFASKDILRIEVSGPQLSHLTVVDLPGFITTSNRYQTQEDVDSIAQIAHHYMKNPRTIILAIVSAAYDFAIQPVVQKARELDPTGVRTIGLITKPDKAEGSRIDEFIQLATNSNVKLSLGWHVLKNRGHGEAEFTPSQRDQREEHFFNGPKWNTLPRDICGIKALRPRLSVQLQRHIRDCMPKVQDEIARLLKNCETELDKLGQGRDTIPEMRVWLIDLCAKSKQLTDLAKDGQYKNPIRMPFFPQAINKTKIPSQKLRARINEATEQFVDEIRTQGHRFDIVNDDTSIFPNGFSRRQINRAQYIKDEVAPLHRESTGEELPGDYNPYENSLTQRNHELLVYRLFQGYSTEWSIYAQAHKVEIEKICQDFLDDVVHFVWPQYMWERLKSALLDEQMQDRLIHAEEEAKKIYDDRERYVKTYDREYAERMDIWRETVASNPEIKFSVHEEILQKMLIYYDLTCKTFVSNMIVQVVERHLLDGLGEVFDIAKLATMDDAQIEYIAAENEEIRKTRLDLKERRRVFNEGFRICRSIAMRRDLGPSTIMAHHSANNDSDDDNEVRPNSLHPSPLTPPPTATRQPRREPPHPPLPARPTTPLASAGMNSNLPGSWEEYNTTIQASAPAPTAPTLDDGIRIRPVGPNHDQPHRQPSGYGANFASPASQSSSATPAQHEEQLRRQSENSAQNIPVGNSSGRRERRGFFRNS